MWLVQEPNCNVKNQTEERNVQEPNCNVQEPNCNVVGTRTKLIRVVCQEPNCNVVGTAVIQRVVDFYGIKQLEMKTWWRQVWGIRLVYEELKLGQRINEPLIQWQGKELQSLCPHLVKGDEEKNTLTNLGGY